LTGFAASQAQRSKVRHQGCIVCGPAHDDFTCGPIDPAHVIPRSMLSAGQDDPLAVVGLGRQVHRRYDTGDFDLLPYLERHARQELAFAVVRFGLVNTLQRVTNERLAA
jgi:hypothetical protein